MRKLLTASAALAVLAMFAFGAPAAQAGHDRATAEGDATHEGWPGGTGHNPAAVEPDEPILSGTLPSGVCSVTGNVTTTAYDGAVVNGTNVPFLDGPAPQHSVSVPALNNNASHTHYQFNELVLQCVGSITGALAVASDGGNDGHLPILPEDDADGNGEHDFSNTAGNQAGDLHHGSVNLSAWSNNSQYGAACAEAGATTNKADITGTQGADTARGWVKYTRLATWVQAWGAFLCGAGPGVGKTFWSDLILSPDIDVTGPTGAFAIHGLARLYG